MLDTETGIVDGTCGRRPPLLLAVGLALLLGLAGCGEEDDNPVNPGNTPSTTNFTGTFMNGSEGGMMTVTIETRTLATALPAGPPRVAPNAGRVESPRAGSARTHEVEALGTLSPEGGGTVTLTGTYIEETDSLAMSGGGYTFDGKYDESGTVSGIFGTYRGPSGTGSFVAAVGGTSVVDVYCGTFESTSGSGAGGRWNMVFAGDVVVGLAANDGVDTPFPFGGTVTGAVPNRDVEVSGSDGSLSLTASGTLNITTHTTIGFWSTSVGGAPGDNGTWSGELCQIGGTGPN